MGSTPSQELFETWTHRLEALPAEHVKWMKGAAVKTLTIRASEPVAAAPLPELERLADVEPIKVIAQGGMGQITLGRQRSIGREVALKSVRSDRDSENTRQELFEEGRVTGRLEHPNVIPVHAMGRDAQGAPVFAMRRVDGVSWIEVFADPSLMPRFYADMSLREAHLEIFDQVCQAAHYAHSLGILHRDIKPDNVLLGPHGEVYLSDWGLAVAMEDTPVSRGLPRVSEITAAVGTPVYMAPEMARSETEKMDARTDVYLLGATLHLILTGTFRHSGASPVALLVSASASLPVAYDESVPMELARLCNSATHVDPLCRPQSADELRRAVRAWQRHASVHSLLEQADQHLHELERLATQAHLADAHEMQTTYRLYGSALFGYEQAEALWPENLKASKGRARVLQAMFDISVSLGDLHAASSLLKMFEAPDVERARRLKSAQEGAEKEAERVRALERVQREHDPRRDRRTLGYGALVTLLLLGGMNALYMISFQNGWLTRDVGPLLAIKLVDTIIMQGCLVVMLMWKRVNQIMRKGLYVFSWSVWFAWFVRAVSLTYGLELVYSGVLETMAYLLGLTAVGIFLDRRLVFLTPLFLGLVGVRLMLPEYGMPLRIVSNLGVLALVGLLMMRGLGANPGRSEPSSAS